MKKIILFALVLFIGFLFVPIKLEAQLNADVQKSIMGQTQAGADTAKIGKPADIRITATRVISTVLETIGMVFMLLIVYAGYIFITAEGEEEKVKKAMNIIKPAVVGLIVILMSYGITLYVGTRFGEAVTEGVKVTN